MADSRTILKAFFETGDIPTEAQFASLIDSLLSLEDNSNLKNGLKIKSQTDGKFQLIIDDNESAITTDGDNFVKPFIIFKTTAIDFEAGGTKLALNFNAAASLRSDFDQELQLMSGNGRGIIILKDSGSGLVRVKLDSLETFANNADAIAGGLELKEIYKTATGELRIVI